MPADYSSTARALALPISPVPSPSPDHSRTGSNARPPWSQRLSSNSRRGPYSISATPSRRQTYQDQTIQTAKKVLFKLQKAFLKLSLTQRVLLVLALVAINIFGILFLIYSESIFAYIGPAAQKWKAVPFGWTILWILCFFCAFPPLVGFGTIVTISGFVYGFPNGWFIVATATVAGSLACFIASRTILSGYVHRLVGEDKRFQALALTLKHDGLKVLCMIRFCPLPYSLSNAAMSTFPTVNPISFAIATAIASPRLLIQVFIGSRLAQIAESGGKMDAGTKAINWASIIFGMALGGTVGYVIYQKTMARAKQLEIDALERAGEEGRIVVGREYSDSTIDGMAGDEDAAVLMGDDDISLWGNDDVVGVYKDDDDEIDVFARGDAGSDSEGGRKPGR